MELLDPMTGTVMIYCDNPNDCSVNCEVGERREHAFITVVWLEFVWDFCSALCLAEWVDTVPDFDDYDYEDDESGETSHESS